jgi:hypothetical protein
VFPSSCSAVLWQTLHTGIWTSAANGLGAFPLEMEKRCLLLKRLRASLNRDPGSSDGDGSTIKPQPRVL